MQAFFLFNISPAVQKYVSYMYIHIHGLIVFYVQCFKNALELIAI